MTATGHPGELSGETILPPGRFCAAHDFRCHDGTPYPLAFFDTWLLLRDLHDLIVEDWARLIGREPDSATIETVSGYRSDAYNQRKIKESAAHQVASGSKHVKGEAEDIRPITGGDASALHRMIMRDVERYRAKGLNGLGLYPSSNWVHVDVRPMPPDRHLARWLGT